MRFIYGRKRLLFFFLLVLLLPVVTVFALDAASVTGQRYTATPYLIPYPSPTYPPRPIPTFFPSPVPLGTGMPAGTSVDVRTIHQNELVEGQFGTSITPVQHVFEGRQGQLVIVNVTVTEPIGYNFYLADINGYSIQELMRFGTGVMAFLPYDGTFMVTLNPYYQYGNPVDYSLIVTTPESSQVSFGGSESFTLSPENPVRAFTFQGDQGDLISLDARSDSATPNPVTLLIDPVGRYVMADSRYSNRAPYPGNGRISLYSLPVTQEYYTVVFTEYQQETTGVTFDLDVVEPTPIEGYGVPVTGQFDETNQVAYYSFEGQYADILDITLTSEDDLDTIISLFGPNNADYRLTDDDGGERDDPEILNFLINPDGQYLIEVQPFNAQVVGEYTLMVALSDHASLDSGPQRVDLGKNPQQYLSFAATDGDQIRLEVRVLNGFMPVMNITQQHALIANIGMGDLESFVTEFTVPDEGAVLVSFSPGRYYAPNPAVEVSIERLNSIDE